MMSKSFQRKRKGIRKSLLLWILLSSISFTNSFSSPSTSRKKAVIGKNIAKSVAIPSIPKAPIAKRELAIGDLALAGALAAVIGDVGLHPIDCIKTVQQSDLAFGMNLFDSSKYIWENFGFFGFYSGLGPYIFGDSLGSAVKFAAFENFKIWASKNINEKHMGSAVFICAGLSFLVASIVVVPGELIKQRMQMGQIISMWDGINSIYETDGVLGFYKGFTPLCMRDVPYTMLELGLYDFFKRSYSDMKNIHNKEGGKIEVLTQMEEIYAAAITGGVAGYVTTPFDALKTKIMVDDEMMYTGFIDCLVKSINEHGFESLCQGGVARIAWLVPFTAIYLPCYDLIKRKLETIGVSKQ
mmetsp:Transcript_14678/g.16706  ORF Transcript_14678/g.16706 Transcript_14678/m.16706 type:complete len:355 (+) Transcript_14678:34-1098(+)